jgi:hypothetical protein
MPLVLRDLARPIVQYAILFDPLVLAEYSRQIRSECYVHHLSLDRPYEEHGT